MSTQVFRSRGSSECIKCCRDTSNAKRCLGSLRSSVIMTTFTWRRSARWRSAHPAPMKRDTIFRIASITKPITAVAAMILVEECKLRLDDSIEPWLPELANRRVLQVHLLGAR